MVIATSAFGLGIDYPGIRSVVHACVPETVDRWYQEVGRGGRDGNASVALLAPARGDGEEAASLGLRMLTPELALDRWNFLWDTRRRIGARSFIDLHTPTPGTLPGSYTHRWNSQLLRGLQYLGQISRYEVSQWEAAELGLEWSAGQHDWQETYLLTEQKHDVGFFQEKWVPRRDQAAAPIAEAFEAMKSVLKRGTSVCTVISQAYQPDDGIRKQFGEAAATLAPESGCGRCGDCREQRILPPAQEPPKPTGTWAAAPKPLSVALASLLEQCPSALRVAVLTDDEPPPGSARWRHCCGRPASVLCPGTGLAPPRPQSLGIHR